MTPPPPSRLSALAALIGLLSFATTSCRQQVEDNVRGLIHLPPDGVVIASWPQEPAAVFPRLVAAVGAAFPASTLHPVERQQLVHFWFTDSENRPARAIFSLRYRGDEQGGPFTELIAYPVSYGTDPPPYVRTLPPTEKLLKELRKRS